jgi:hypothetical protein
VGRPGKRAFTGLLPMVNCALDCAGRLGVMTENLARRLGNGLQTFERARVDGPPSRPEQGLIRCIAYQRVFEERNYALHKPAANRYLIDR